MDVKDVPLDALVGSFLKACAVKKVEATVIAIPRGNTKQTIASNGGQRAIGRATAALLGPATGGIDAAAIELHEAKFRAEDGTILNAGCPVCGERTPYSDVPDVSKEFHRMIVKLVISKYLTLAGQSTQVVGKPS
jgi:hypothetical protein